MRLERPALSRELVLSADFQAQEDILVPGPEVLDLPEKAVQFGTGAFLRGFVDAFIDEANRKAQFGGRIVLVGSTGSGRTRLLNAQDGLYTLVIQGLDRGEPRSERRVISAVSRALSALDDWDAVLACARSPDLELIFSNTTEIGIVLDDGDEPALEPPRSFPGKLTRFLYERARAFDYHRKSGVVVIPCELIENNGDCLRDIVLALAGRWKLGEAFASWVEEAVPFCNTLVDRIVPGTPAGGVLDELSGALGYRDELLTVCEAYRLFAIEGDDALRRRLAFAGTDAGTGTAEATGADAGADAGAGAAETAGAAEGIVVTGDVAPYRQRKVRLLNGTHTLMVSPALLCGRETVRDTMEDDLTGSFTRRMLLEELVPTLDVPGAKAFALQVLDRFSNPFIRHELFDITLHATAKMRVRVVPSILRYGETTGRAPESVAFAFAAFLLFMRGDLQNARRTAGLVVPHDDRADRFRALWGSRSRDALVKEVCSDEELWGVDLGLVPGFVQAVTLHLSRLESEGAPAALEAHLALGAGRVADAGHAASRPS